MENDEVKPIFLKTLALSLLIVVANIGYFVYKNLSVTQKVTGFSIKDSVFQSFTSLTFTSKIFLILESIILIAILIFAGYRDVILKKTKNESIDLHIKRNVDKNKTDLDTLYEILKDKKELPISVISKSFDIDKELAMEWCKILESGELVTISYFGFSEPIVRINQANFKNVNYQKSSIENDSIEIKF